MSAVEKSMTQKEQENALTDDLTKLIDRYLMEFDMSAPTIIGVLESAKLDVWDDSRGIEVVVDLE